MASKKNKFDLFNIVDEDLLESLRSSGDESIAPTEKEVDIVKTAEGEVITLPISSLVEYHNHTYKVLDNADMDVLVDSIRDYGIILPLIVREINDGKYEIVSGHRRHFAAKKLGLTEVPCKVTVLDDDMADIIMADTNIAREQILPSEKAKTYRVRLDAAVRQGKKTMEEIKNIADDAPDSARQIQRYLKLAELDPSLLDMVDAGSIPVTAGVTLSDLSKKHQKLVAEVAISSGHSPSLKDAENLKKAASRGLTAESATDILLGKKKPKAASKPKKPVLKEEMFWDAVPDDIKKLPLDQRVEHYKKAIKAYKS